MGNRLRFSKISEFERTSPLLTHFIDPIDISSTSYFNHFTMDDLELAAVAAVQTSNAMILEALGAPAAKKQKQIDGRGRHNSARSKRRVFEHEQALECIKRDYLGLPGKPDTPLFGKEFSLQFRISRSRFQCLLEDVMANKERLSFFHVKESILGEPVASLEARLLLPLKCLAYGVPPHTFIDYFQMSMPLARRCCIEFDKAIKLLYQTEYLRLPTVNDIKNIVGLHKDQHEVDGLFGSLDCSHTYWKNCPKAWQGSYKGKEDKASIVLEGICDYNLFFWHASYGYAGTMNDLNILALSPLLERLIDGSFDELEKEARVVPFKIEEEEFSKLFILVDGIYPKYCRFVKGIKEPITPEQSRYTAWQEACRKDNECY